MNLKEQLTAIILTLVITAIVMAIVSSIRLGEGKLTFRFDLMDVVSWTLLLSGMLLMTSYAKFKGGEEMKKKVIEIIKEEKQAFEEELKAANLFVKTTDPAGFEKLMKDVQNKG